MRKKFKKLNIVGVIIIITLVAMQFYYILVVCMKTEPATEATETNEDAAVYSLSQFKEVMSTFDDFHEVAERNHLEDEEEYGTFIIPGLKATKTILGHTGELAMCTSMTPQGLAVTDKYLLVSAYCHTHEHNSVIYVIDKLSHKFVKTVVLPDRPHAGGLAYDSDHGIVWVSGRRNKVAYANSYNLKDIESYSFENGNKPLLYDQKVPLIQFPRNSFMTYKDGCLYAGYFDMDDDGVLYKYVLNEDGILDLEVAHTTKDSVLFSSDGKQYLPFDFAKMPSLIQAISFMGEDYMLVTESYGVMQSRLRVFYKSAEKGNGYYFSDADAVTSYILPAKLEYAVSADGKIYLLFEAAAYEYRVRPGYCADRILTFDIDDDITKIE